MPKGPRACGQPHPIRDGRHPAARNVSLYIQRSQRQRVQGTIFPDYFRSTPGGPPGFTLPLTAPAAAQKQPAITTNFSSKSEGALHLSVDGQYLTYMGYNAVASLEGISNSETTNSAAQITGATGPFYDRAVALVTAKGAVTVTPGEFRL